MAIDAATWTVRDGRAIWADAHWSIGFPISPPTLWPNFTRSKCTCSDL
jgi:hypothetical protein